MDDQDGPRRFGPYSYRDELIDEIVDVNTWFATGPDRLTRYELDLYPDDALEREYELQRKLLYDVIMRRVKYDQSTDRQSAIPGEAGPGSGSFYSVRSGQFIWERSG